MAPSSMPDSLEGREKHDLADKAPPAGEERHITATKDEENSASFPLQGQKARPSGEVPQRITSAAAGQQGPSPHSHLLPDEEAILKDQAETLKREYPIWHIYHYATKVDMVIIILAALASCASGAAMPAMTIVFGNLQGTFQDYLVLHHISKSQFEAEIINFVLYFVYLAIGSFFATYVSTVGFMYTGEHITTTIRQKYLESCLRQNIAFFDKVSAGEVASRITSDANKVQDGISEKIGLLITSLATLVSGFLIGFIVSWKLTLIMSSVFAALLLNTAVWSACIRRYTGPLAMSATRCSTLTQEVFSAIRMVVAFGSEKTMTAQYDGYLKSCQHYGFRIKAGIGLMIAVFIGIMPLTYGLGFWQGSLFLARRELSIEEMVTTILTVMIGSSNIGSVGPNLQAVTDGLSTASALMVMIDRKTPLDATNTVHGDKPLCLQGHLRLERIKHVYPSRPEVTVLDDLNVEFEAGKVTALVGASGSGKSTIIELIQRFYKPLRGKVLLDDRDISEHNLQWLRQNIGVVGQQPVLFSGSISDNIRHGLVGSAYEFAAHDVQQERIFEAAKMSKVDDFVSQLPDGYATDVGQRGLLLSGGQKQRIAIARAIVANPKSNSPSDTALFISSSGTVITNDRWHVVLLLDEATSALDMKSEAVVQSALEKASQGRTTITIAHRLSTVRNADKIILLANGKVVEQGDHDDLMRKRGAYYHSVSTQQFQSTNDQEDIPPDIEKSSIQDGPSPDDQLRVSKDGSKSASPHSSMMEASTHDTNDEGESPPNDTHHSFWTLVKFVFGFSKPEMYLMTIALLFCIIGGLTTPVQSIFFAKQLTTLSHMELPGSNRWQVRHDSNFWSLMLLMLGLVSLAAYAIQSVLFAFTAEALVRRVKRETMRYILRQDIGFFDVGINSSGALTAFLALETTQLTNMSGANLGSIMTSLSIIVGGISLSLAIGWKLALVCLSVVPLLVCCSILRFHILHTYHSRASRVYLHSAAFAAESIAAMRTVATLTLEKHVAEKYRADVERQRKSSLISVAKSGAVYSASQSLIFLCLGLSFWYGSRLMVNMEYDIFQFFVCLMSVIFGAQSAGMMLTFIPDIVKAKNSAARLKTLYDRQPAIDTWDDAHHHQHHSNPSTSKAKRLEFRNVHFRYPTRPDKAVLRGLSFVVEPGQRVGLVGASGCGKSTIISLLERFYDVASGNITIDGFDITKINVADYRSHFSLVGQEPTLFQGTIRDNIRLGASSDSNASDDAVEQACRDANIYDFIVSLPSGFDTDIGASGGLLSGGQKQRIAIARALVRNPGILLLDEATSALDSESELAVQSSLSGLSRACTTITVAHRLSTVIGADKIMVMDDGRIAEAGTHRELMALGGRYAELYKLQSLES